MMPRAAAARRLLFVALVHPPALFDLMPVDTVRF
jgi:hypothetical protein